MLRNSRKSSKAILAGETISAAQRFWRDCRCLISRKRSSGLIGARQAKQISLNLYSLTVFIFIHN
jgi:hypothetical protein